MSSKIVVASVPEGNYTSMRAGHSTAGLRHEGNSAETVSASTPTSTSCRSGSLLKNPPIHVTKRLVIFGRTAKFMPLPLRASLTAMVLIPPRKKAGFTERSAAHAEYCASGFRRNSETVFTVSGNSFHSHSEKPCLSRNFVGRRVCPGQFNRRRKPIAATMATLGSSERTTGMMPAGNVRRDGMGKPGNHGLTLGNHLGVPRWSRSSGLTNRSSAGKCPRKCH